MRAYHRDQRRSAQPREHVLAGTRASADATGSDGGRGPLVRSIRRSTCATARILLVSHDALYRCGLRAILEDQPDFEIAGETPDCQEVQRCVHRVNANVVLLHLRGHDLSPAAIRVMTDWIVTSSVRVLVLTSSCGELTDEAAALRAGASGLLPHTASPAELAAAVRLVAAGYGLYTQSIIDKLGAAQQIGIAPEVVPTRFLRLTTREQQVFHLMAAGSGNAEIAAALTLGENTIKSHVQHILTKLDLPNRRHAVIFAHKHGLVTTRVQ